MARAFALTKLYVIAVAAMAATSAVADVIVDPEVLEAIGQGRARVIVELHLDDDFKPEGELTEPCVRAQRAAIAAAQESLLSELADRGAQLTRRPKTIPFLALEIGAPALADLRASPDRVVRILKDDAAAVTTGETP